jgi:hypothetical protein
MGLAALIVAQMRCHELNALHRPFCARKNLYIADAGMVEEGD